jgi:large subunit ribosomal protein L19
MIVRVWQIFQEKNKEIVTPFEGIVIAIKNKNRLNMTFTVRGKAAGQYVEKIYPYHSPVIKKIEILGESKTRRAKLYFVRKLSDYEIRKKLKPVYK